MVNKRIDIPTIQLRNAYKTYNLVRTLDSNFAPPIETTENEKMVIGLYNWSISGCGILISGFETGSLIKDKTYIMNARYLEADAEIY